MFGKPTFPSGTNTSAFGGNSLFGSQARPNSFGSAPPATGSLFGQKPIFGSGQTTSLFGSAQPTSSASTSIFGQQKQLFGSSATPQTSTFGSQSLFANSQASHTGGLFGSSFGSTVQNGTALKFDAPISSDTMIRNNGQQNISTKHMCISAMKHYEGKSLEELRYEDYLANRKGGQATGLSFGQPSQSATSTGSSLFGGSSTTTQSSLFGQNKSIFGASSFGTSTTTTQSLFTSTAPISTSTSLFGAKPATGGIFGSSGTSAFGQPQTGTSLFGAKPTTGFGTSGGSLFGGSSTFGSTAPTTNTFTFGSNTTSTTPFGQSQPTGFGAFGQTSSASTGLFGSKPATSGFGNFGTSTASTFGSQLSGGGLFGSKPASGGLFGTGQGSTLFGSQPATSASLFSSTAAKPAASMFGTTTTQATFGSIASASPQVVTAPVAPIVLGADLSQTILTNTLIEKQIQGSSYGDSSLLKLGSSEDLERAGLPNPTSVEKQLRFLNSKAAASKSALSAAVVVPKPIRSFSFISDENSKYDSPRNKSFGDVSYRSAFTLPSSNSLTTSHRIKQNSIVVDGDTENETSVSLIERADGDAEIQKHEKKNIKRLDLKMLQKIMRGDRETNAAGSSHSSVTNILNDSSTNRTDRIDVNHQDIINNQAVHVVEINENISNTKDDFRSIPDNSSHFVESSTTQLSKNTEFLRSNENTPKKMRDVNVQTICKAPAVLLSSVIEESERSDYQLKKHPGGITLTRQDYECEPTLRELAVLAEKGNGVCHIKEGFTVRRLAYGSVFWPGPFDLSNVDLDEIVSFRRHEIIVYPDDNSKPPIGEILNRPAEISLERVWPRDKKTGEYITDPSLMEVSGFRERLERASARIGAKFKDYRSETGTWVFTVPHFTKYGLTDSDDEDMPSAKELKLAMVDKRKQFVIQRSRLASVENRIMDVSVECTSETNEDSKETLAKIGFGGEYSSFLEKQTKSFSSKEFDSLMDKKEQLKHDREAKISLDYSLQLEKLYHDSFMDVDQPKKRGIIVKRTEKKFLIENMVPLRNSTINGMCLSKRTVIDQSVFNLRKHRVGWATNGLLAINDHRSFNVNLAKLVYRESIPLDYLKELFVVNRLNSLFFSSSQNDGSAPLIGIKTGEDYASLIDSYISISDRYEQFHESSIFRLCKALFCVDTAERQHENVQRLDNIRKWLRDFVPKSSVDNDICTKSPEKRILNALQNGNVDSAISEAVASDFPHLALALSTFLYSSRKPYKEQLEYWMKTGEIEYIDEDLMRVYMIMSGDFNLKLKKKTIFVNERLDWIKSLSVFIWYSDADVSLQEILTNYEVDIDKRNSRDDFNHSVFFQLIKLAADRSQPLENVLDPSCIPAHCLNYHYSWHLWCILYSIGYRHLHASVEFSLITGYAEQVNQLDLPHLSAYILLHIPSYQSRRENIMNHMQRIAPSLTEETFSQLSEFCSLQETIIAVAKYFHTKFIRDYDDMCRYALLADMLDEAHEVLIEIVAPKAVIHDDCDLLSQYDEAFDSKILKIANWAIGGQIFFDFNRLKKAIQEIDDDDQVEKLLEFAHSLELRLRDFAIRSSIQRLSLAIMSHFVFELLNKLESCERTVLPMNMENIIKLGGVAFAEDSHYRVLPVP